MTSYSNKYDNVHFLFRTKVELIVSQTAAMDTAVAAASSDEEGPWKNWHALASRDLLYLPLVEPEGEPLGILQLGGFPNMLMPEWWVRPELRGCGLGHRVAYEFGMFVRAKGGTQMVPPYVVGKFFKTSKAMVDQFYKGLKGLPENHKF